MLVKKAEIVPVINRGQVKTSKGQVNRSKG